MRVIFALYLLFAACLTGAYIVAEMFGFESASAAYERIEPSVRASPGSTGVVHSGGGGTFWHSGSHGGK
jgi:hypothetical protein